jgi:hypothetical protein
MWNLSGDDIHRAKEELKTRRAAIKARYDNEIKQLEADIAAIETFERAAADFMSSFKLEGGGSAPVAEPEPAPAPEKKPADSAQTQSQPASVPTPIEKSVAAEAVPEPVPNPEPAAAEKSSSRWRMRLNAREGSS